MGFLKALLTEGIQFVIMIFVAFGAVCIGCKLRKMKNKSLEEDK